LLNVINKGYETSLWSASSRILFKDLVHDDTKTKNTASKTLESSYELEILPRIPIADEVEFFLEDSNNNYVLVDSMTQAKSAVLPCRLGTCQSFKARLKCKGSSLSDVDMLEVNCWPVSESALTRLNASVTARICEDWCRLQVDSSGFSSDCQETGSLEVACVVEVKYTNGLGREANLRHALKRQVTVRFERVFSACIDRVREIE